VQEIWQPNITAWIVILADLSAEYADLRRFSLGQTQAVRSLCESL